MALQSLGSLYFVKGEIQMGRHYLRRAVDIIEKQHGTITHFGGEDCYHWLLDYLVSSFSMRPGWRTDVGNGRKTSRQANEQTSRPTNKQTEHDFQCLKHFVQDDESFTPRMHYELGLTLWELGAWEVARKHMGDYGVGALEAVDMDDDYGIEVSDKFLNVMRFRLATDFPVVVEGAEEKRELWRGMKANLHKLLRMTSREVMETPIDEIQDAMATLPLFHFAKDENTSENLRKTFELLRRIQPELNQVAGHLVFDEKGKLPKRKNQRIRVGVVGPYLCSHQVGRIVLPLITGLPRDRFRVHVFGFPSIVDSWAQAISWNADNYVPLPWDFGEAKDIIGAANMDVLLFSDYPDVVTSMISMLRLAPVQAGFFVRGAVRTSGLGSLDYYLMPELLVGTAEDTIRSPHENFQVVTLKGLGLPFDPPQFHNSLKIKYEIGGRRFFSDDNLYLVIDPIPSSVSSEFDVAFVEVLRRDPRALIIFAPDFAESILNFGSSSAFSAELGPQQWCQRLLGRIRKNLDGEDHARIVLMDPLKIEERNDLLVIGTAVLNVLESGGVASLEAYALGVPVISMKNSFGANLAKRFGVASECVGKTYEDFGEIASKLGLDENLRHDIRGRIVRSRVGDVIQKMGEVGGEGSTEIAKFLENAVYLGEGGKKKKKRASRWDTN